MRFKRLVMSGYVYYEVDCFPKVRNPYLPLDLPNPTMLVDLQTPLTGPGCEERREVVESVRELWRRIVRQEELCEEEGGRMERYFRLLCDDILRERRRIGGDWAVSGCLLHRRIRQIVRDSLGPDLVVVVLRMAEEDVRERIVSRHEGAEDLQSSLLVRSQHFSGLT